jgi:NADH-quinone oxidoreductase subunit G
MAKIQIDGKFYEVSTELNLLETCLALGFDIPYFCNHPALGSVGACRQCAVKKYAGADDKKGKIVMSCMEPVSDGLIISIVDPEVAAFRAAVIESLMTNHPHDCPICDEGGECHLQDMTVMTGHDYRRFTFKKRTHRNQELGPFIQHEMNRCIQCYRCVRFYKDYSGGKDFNVFGSARQVFFGRYSEGILENEFSGNLVEVCPTGVFTDKTLSRHFARKWDLTNAPSICVHCSLGCNIIVSERYGTVRRILSRYNGAVNGYFICDRGRFGYEFINNPERIKKILIRPSKESDLREAGELPHSLIKQVLNGGKTIGIGSPRASLEANFALSALVGKNNFYHGISERALELTRKAVSLMEKGIAYSPSLKDIEVCDAVLVLGEDVTNTAPMLALALRQALRNRSFGEASKVGIPQWNDAAVREIGQDERNPLFIATPFATKLDDKARETFRLAPADMARLGYAVASEINAGAPVVPDAGDILRSSAKRIATALSEARNPLIVTGISMGNEEILNASANIAIALSAAGKKPSISVILPECNSAGLSMIEGESLDTAIEVINKTGPDTLIILENDLFGRIQREKADKLFENCQQVIVIDHLMNETAGRADILLPAATFAESDGTLINNEGRAQRYYNVLPVTGQVKESWRWISELARLSGTGTTVKPEKFDDAVAALVSAYPNLSAIKENMPAAGFRFYNEKIARQNKRFSGRTAMNANIAVSEKKPPQDEDSPLGFTMEGYKGDPPSSLLPYYWSPGWNSVQAMSKYMDVPDGHLKEGGDPGIRLFSYRNDGSNGYFKEIPLPFRSKPSELLVVPVYMIFGSEELSSKAEAIAERISGPFITLNEKEMSGMHLAESGYIELTIEGELMTVKVKKDNSLPDGVAGLSVTTLTGKYSDLPLWGNFLTAHEKKVI